MQLSVQTNEAIKLEEIEQHILSAFVFNYSKVIETTPIESVRSEIFTSPIAKIIFQELQKMPLVAESFDLIIIQEELKKTITDTKVYKKALDYLSQLTDDSNFFNIQKYIAILEGHQKKTNINKICKAMIDGQYHFDDIDCQIDKFSGDISKILFQDKLTNYLTSEELVDNYNNNLASGAVQIDSLSTRFTKLDQKIKGLKPSQLVIIASRPAIGKTTFAINLINKNLDKISKEKTNSSENKNPAIGIFSLEMTSKKLLEKLIGINGQIELDTVEAHGESRLIKTQDLTVINAAKDEIKGAELLFCDETSIPLSKIIATIKVWNKQYDLKLVIIDYLQLVVVPSDRDPTTNQYQKIGVISRELKKLSMELDICIICLAQLNRKSEDRKSSDKSPILSDLRESGSIEQDADIVLFLYHEQTNTPSDAFESHADHYTNSDNNFVENIKLKVGKNRHGPTGEIDFKFRKSIGVFQEIHED